MKGGSPLRRAPEGAALWTPAPLRRAPKGAALWTPAGAVRPRPRDADASLFRLRAGFGTVIMVHAAVTGPPKGGRAGRQAADKGLANPGFLSYNRYGILTTGGFPVHYLDNSATTPVLREAAERAFQVMTADFGNPSSQHKMGIEAAHILKESRETVSDALHVTPGEIIFTSCGTESTNMALWGAARRRKKGHIL